MNESDYNELREKSWQRKLTAAETAALTAWLAEHPDSEADWEVEARLTQALGGLPDAPVPSNFTARVLQAIEREASAPARPAAPRWTWMLRSLLPKVAAVAVVLGVGVLTFHEHAVEKRAELVRGVTVVTGVSSLPSPEILQDFETIRQMRSTTPGADGEIIALFKPD